MSIESTPSGAGAVPSCSCDRCKKEEHNEYTVEGYLKATTWVWKVGGNLIFDGFVTALFLKHCFCAFVSTVRTIKTRFRAQATTDVHLKAMLKLIKQNKEKRQAEDKNKSRRNKGAQMTGQLPPTARLAVIPCLGLCMRTLRHRPHAAPATPQPLPPITRSSCTMSSRVADGTGRPHGRPLGSDAASGKSRGGRSRGERGQEAQGRCSRQRGGRWRGQRQSRPVDSLINMVYR